MKKKLIDYQVILIILLGFVLGIFAYFNAIQSLINLQLDLKYSINDLLYIILVNKSFDTYEFLDRNNLFLYMNLFMFMISNLLISCSKFLIIPKSYHSFIYLRSQNRTKALKMIRGNPIMLEMSYICSYFLGFFLGVFLGYPSKMIYLVKDMEGKLFLGLIGYLIVKIILIEVISQFIFIMYLKKDAAIAFLSGIILIFLFIFIDLVVESSFFILFNEEDAYVGSLFILTILKGVLNKISYDWLRVDTILEGEYI